MREGEAMKAIVVSKPYEIKIADVEDPQIKSPDEVLIKVKNGGICGSDIGIYTGENSLATYPRIIGHEFGGEVIEVGPGVTRVKVGDKVAVDPVRSCGNCYACKNNRHNVCKSVKVTGVHLDGGFAQYVVAPENAVYKVDTTKISEDLLCLVEPYSIGMQVNYRGRISENDKVLVMGSGPIGIAVMQVAKYKGASVIITDIVDQRLERAKDMGADRTVNVLKEDLNQVVLEYTDGEGMPVVVDTVCSVKSFPQALDLACQAGRVLVLGLTNIPSEVAQVAITKKELDVIGSRLNNHRFAEVIEAFESRALNPEKMRTTTFHFTEIEKAIELIQNHPEQVCKVTLNFD